MASKEELGLQESGSVKVDRDNDYCFAYLGGLNWNRPLKNTTSTKTWSDPYEWKTSMSWRHMNYEMEYEFLDMNNPTNYGLLPNLRLMENRRKNRKKVEFQDFSLNQQEVREVKPSGQEESNGKGDEDEDFMDEFGNIKDSDEEEEVSNMTKSCQAEVEKEKKKGYKDYDSQKPGKPSAKDIKPRREISFRVEEPRISHLGPSEQKVMNLCRANNAFLWRSRLRDSNSEVSHHL